jgi:hypothetical protein
MVLSMDTYINIYMQTIGYLKKAQKSPRVQWFKLMQAGALHIPSQRFKKTNNRLGNSEKM